MRCVVRLDACGADWHLLLDEASTPLRSGQIPLPYTAGNVDVHGSRHSGTREQQKTQVIRLGMICRWTERTVCNEPGASLLSGATAGQGSRLRFLRNGAGKNLRVRGGKALRRRRKCLASPHAYCAPSRPVRRIIRVISEGTPTLQAKPFHKPVPGLT